MLLYITGTRNARVLDSDTGFDEAGGDVTDDKVHAVGGAFDAVGNPTR